MVLVSALAHANAALFALLGAAPLPRYLAPTTIAYTQRTYTFRSRRARRDFGYAPLLGAPEAIRRMAEDERRRG